MDYLEINQYALRGIVYKRQKATAKKIGIHPDTLARRLENPEKLTIGDVNAIARACNVPVSAFLVTTNQVTDLSIDRDEAVESATDELSGAELEAVLDQLSEAFMAYTGPNPPQLSDYAVSREGIYEEHP